MKKLLVLFLALYSFSLFSQEGTKQLMPNETDRLYLEMYCNDNSGGHKEFATYGAPEKDRLHIYLKDGETMHLGMQMYTDNNYGGNCETDPEDVWFRIKDPNGNVVFGERQMVESGDQGFIDNYTEAVTGPNGVIINETTVSGGYNSLTYTAEQTGNFYIEFYSNENDDDYWYYNYRRFALKYFDVTVTSNDTVVTNPGEPNKSAGRLWSKNWSLTNTSFSEYPAKVYFYVFTSDEFVNKIQYKMKPFSFNFVSNPFGVDNSSSLNVIEQAQSQDGYQIDSDDIAEYKIYLNDPDRSVWKTTALPPPEVKVWHEDQLIYDYDYMREPMERNITLDTLILEKNRPACVHSSLTLFKIKTNVAGFTTILMDIDGNGYSTDGNDRVLHRELKKGRNYILWNFRNDNGDIVSNGPVSISATFYGRGATNFPLYDVETLSEVNTKTKRPFNKLCPTLYWDDSQISDWGDDGGTGSMDETDTTQLVFGNDTIPRVWAFNDSRQGAPHNGNMNTMNSWYNAIDLGRANIECEVVTSDSLCVNGSRPYVADVHVDTTKNDTYHFKESDFTNKFSDPFGNELDSIKILSLPDAGRGTLQLDGANVSAGDIIDDSQLSNLTFIPQTDVTGEATFLWNATNGTYYAEESDTVSVFINTPPDVSPINDTTICTDETLNINFTVNDQDDGHNPDDIEVIAYSNNLNVVPNSGIEVTGSGETRTLKVQPYGIKSGYTIIYLQAYDGVTSIIEQFAIKMSPSLDFTGDTSVCAGSQLELTAVERGADAYIWEREGVEVGTGRTYTDPSLTESETGTYTLTVQKGECVSSRDFEVSIYPIVSFTGDTDLCVGEDLNLSADEPTADAYEWRRSGYELSSSKVLNIQDVETGDSGNDYTLYVRKEGCENTSDPFSVSVIENTDTTLTITGDTINDGQNGTITIENSNNGITYRAYSGDSLVNTAIGTGSALDISIPSDVISIGDNQITVNADNGNCIVEMDETANVHVNAVPVAVNDNASVTEDNNITVDVLDNDSGLEDGGISIIESTSPENGTITNVGDSTITYSPDTDYFGNDSLVYRVCDADAECDSAWVFITVNGVDETPTANADADTTDEDVPVDIDVLANDTNLDGGLTVSITSTPGNGTTSVNPDNTVTYTPGNDYNGSDSFTYRVEDAQGDFDEATVDITINPVNDQPVAIDDAVITDEDTPVDVDVMENDTLADGFQNITITTDASHGTTSVNMDNTIHYAPAKDYNGSDSFVYEIEDTDGETSRATVDVTINPVDDLPVANDTTVTTDEDTDITVEVLANDGSLGDGGLDVSIYANPSDGSATANPDNTVTYSPDNDFNGTDSYTYQVTDANGSTAEATVTVNVNSVNDIPVANDDNLTTDEDTEVTANVLSNDDNLGDGNLVLSIDTDPANGTAQVTGDSSVSYTPDPDYYGSDIFTYQICDEGGAGECDIATVSVNINSVDDQPDAVNDTVAIDEDTDTTMNVIANDTGLGDGGINVTIASGASHGSLQVNANNSITYTPDENYNGPDDFSYEVTDGDGDSDIADVNLDVVSVNDIPVANNDTASTNENTSVTVDVLVNDEGLGDGSLDLTITSAPSNGSVSLNGDNTITYDPDTDYIGTDNFSYEVCDEGGSGECSTASVNITIDNTDDIPVANDDNFTIDEDTDTTLNVLANDQDLNDGSIGVSIINAPSNGSAVVNTDNTVDYSPNADYNGSDSFEYEVCDVDGDCDTAQVNITINAVNDLPVANDDEVSTEEDTDVTVEVLNNDENLGDGGLSITLVDSPSNGDANVNIGDNTITYDPSQDWYGSDSFSYELADNNGDLDTAIVTVNVTSVDDQPVANSDYLTLDEDTEDTVDVISNDTGLGDGGINVNLEVSPNHGNSQVTSDNRIVYDPADDFNGTDTLTYRLCDGDNDCDTSRLYITVDPINDVPVANDDFMTLNEDTEDTVNVLDNDTDLGDGGISVTIDDAANHGVVQVTADNQIVYTPDENYNGPDTLIYDLCDATPDCDTAMVYITVESVNDVPVANDDNVTIGEDNDTIINVLHNDSGLGDGYSNLEVISGANHGSLNVNVSDSTIQYIPNPDYHGPDRFDYRITDGNGDYDDATVNITVEERNDIPVASDDAVTIDEDKDTVINVLSNDSGLGDGISNLEIESMPGNGNASVVGDSIIEYTPNKDYNGSDQFEYRVTDTDNDSDVATVSITINPQNDTPVAVNDTITTDEDKAITFNVLTNDLSLGDGGLSIQITADPTLGTGVVTGDSIIQYTPDSDVYGQDSLTYELSDSDNETSTAKVYITIQPVNDYKPVAIDDERGTAKNTSVDVDVLFNDQGLGDGGITLLIDNAYEPENGSASVTTNNTIEYTPDTDYLGDDSLVYQVYDEDNDVSSAKVLIHVKENNMVPDANDDNVSTHRNTQLFIEVLSNDSNLGDGGIEVTEWIEPSNGEILAIDSNYVQYLPDKNFHGNDRFVYMVSDAEGDYDTASVYITVTDDDNILPLANTDSVTTQEDTEVTYDVLLNDDNLDDGIYTLDVSDSPKNGIVSNVEISGSQGNIAYDPNTDYYGLDSLEYQVCDLNNDCDQGKMIIEVQPVDDHQPVAIDDSIGTSQNTPVTVHVLMNDTALNDGGIKISEYSSPSNGSIIDINNANGTVTYEPATDYLGYDNFEYQITDYDGDTDQANVEVNVRTDNSVPVANADTATTPSGTQVEIDVLANDIAGDGGMENMKVTKFIEPTNGSINVTNDSVVEYTPDVGFSAGIDTFWYKADDVDGDWDTARVSVIVYDGYNHRPDAFDDYRLIEEDVSEFYVDVLENDTALQDAPIHLSVQTDPQNGEITDIAGDSAIAYKPDMDYFGQDSLVYKIRDVNGDWDVAKVYFQITPVDDGIPNANDDSTGTSRNTPVTVDVLMNDENLKDSIKLSKLSDPANGTITVNDSTITYTPATDYLGRDEFEYQISDHDGQSDEARVIIEVRKDNIEPVAFPDSSRTTMDKNVTIHVLRNDTLLDDGVGKVTTFTQPSHGYALVNTDNTVEYQPAEDFIGTDRFVYKVDDIDGDWDTAFVKVQVDSVPDYIPEAEDDYRATQKNTAVDVNVLDNDSGLGDTPLNVWIIGNPDHGDASVDEESHVVTYQPETDYIGKDTLQYAVFDKDDDSDTANVIINVKENNLIPLAIDDSAHTLMNHDVAVHVLNNDSLLQDGVKGVTVFSDPDHGEVKVNQYNVIVYEPYKWYTGTDEFEYQVEDVDGDVDIATVHVTIEEIPNYIPKAKDDSTGTSINQPVTLNVLRNDEGLNNGPITLTMESGPSNGEVTVNSDHTITYTPGKDYLGYDSFEYRVCDYDDECDVATVTVHVRENNTVPVAMNDKVYTYMNESVTVEVLENDSGLDDGMGHITIPGKPTYGTAEVNSDHTITYTPNYWFEGPDTLTYELSDVDGDYDTAYVAIGVLDTPDPLPGISITDISGNTTENREKAYFDVALQAQPSSNVVINISSTDTTEGVMAERRLIFTPDNYDREQTIAMTGVDDNIVDGDIPYRALTENAVSEDSVYNLLTVSNVDIVNEDNDEPGIEITLLSENNRTSEGGDKVELSIELLTQPTAEMIMNVSSTDATEGTLDKNQLLFTPDDSTLTQQLVVTGVDDQEHDGDIDYALQFNTSSEDTSYNNIDIEDFQLVNEDDDEIGMFIPDAFSPNGDDLNDRFTIKGLDQYDNLSIKIYNRWGSLVYSNNDYQNNWNGKANVTTLGNKELSSGTYYYYLKIKDNGETIEGSVYLKR